MNRGRHKKKKDIALDAEDLIHEANIIFANCYESYRTNLTSNIDCHLRINYVIKDYVYDMYHIYFYHKKYVEQAAEALYNRLKATQIIIQVKIYWNGELIKTLKYSGKWKLV